MKVWIGIDNGISGTVGIIKDNGQYNFCNIPVFLKTDYQKKSNHYITRLDYVRFKNLLDENIDYGDEVKVLIEYPLVNPKLFKSTISAVRCLESLEIVLEEYGLDYDFIQAREWQKYLGIKGDTKIQSANKGIELFSKCKVKIEQHGDADGLLIAQYLKEVGK